MGAASEEREIKLVELFIPPKTKFYLVTIAILLAVAIYFDCIWQDDVVKFEGFFDKCGFVVLLRLELHDLPWAG
ncbi:hypothetical protein D3C79_848900 [compost metagenome]